MPSRRPRQKSAQGRKTGTIKVMSGKQMFAAKKASGLYGGRYAGMEMPYSEYVKKPKIQRTGSSARPSASQRSGARSASSHNYKEAGSKYWSSSDPNRIKAVMTMGLQRYKRHNINTNPTQSGGSQSGPKGTNVYKRMRAKTIRRTSRYLR